MTTKKHYACDVCRIPMSDGQIAAMNRSWHGDAKAALDTLRSSGASRSQRIAATTTITNIIEELIKRERGLIEAMGVPSDEILSTAQKLTARIRELEAFNKKMAVVLLDASNAAFRSTNPWCEVTRG